MVKAKSMTLPVIPLPRNSVLLPGVTLRISLNNRPDVVAPLAHLQSRATTPRAEQGSISIACIPLNSPYLNPDGQRLIEEGADKKGQIVVDDPAQAKKEDLFNYGTVARLSGLHGTRGTREDQLLLVVEGTSRFKVESITEQRRFFEAKVVLHEEEVVNSSDRTIEELFTSLKQLSRELLALLRLAPLLRQAPSMNLSPILARRLQLYIERKEIEEAGVLADFMANLVEATHEEKLRVLCALSVKDRLERVIELLQKQISNVSGNAKVLSITSNSIGGVDIDQLRRNQQNPLRRMLPNGQIPGGLSGLPPGFGGNNQGDDEGNELEELKKRLEDAKLSPEAENVAQRELKRLQRMNPAQAEYQVCRNYLETLAEIPWTKMTEDKLDAATLSRARKQLDDDHYGLEKIKKRLLEYLAVLKLKQSINSELDAQIKRLTEQGDASKSETGEMKADASSSGPVSSDEELQVMERKRMVDKSPILLLVGPPGTGKTSLAKSVATALGRKFHRISLGGVRDEAEIRGHRRTYVAAMPGLIVNGLKKVGIANPVFLLDEIDKVGTSNFHGDPSAAMLEVLDPEQNHTFTDHYVNIPLDLSKVLFIATANSLDTIPPPLLDRMETITLSGYTTLEKRHIATRHLIPKQILTNGLSLQPPLVDVPTDVLDKIITSYTRESGVRNLEREIGSVCRFKAVEYADAKDSSSLSTYNPQVKLSDLEEILGIERYDEEIAESSARPGVVTGLVAYSTGGQGSILFIEVADMPGTGRVQLTGKLGDVLKESVEVALTWVKAHAFALALTSDPNEDIMKNRSIHVHCPGGAIPKDGPSAGLAHTVALISLFSGRVVPVTMAMTGEVSLRGKVAAVGGIKEKVIGAMRAGVKTVLLPAGNRKDVRDLPGEVREGMEIVHVGHIWEALRHIWPDAHWPGEQHWSGVESRL